MKYFLGEILNESSISVFAHAESLFCILAIDSQCNYVCCRCQCPLGELGERFARKHCNHSYQMFFYNQWIAGKGNYTFLFRPVLITNVLIIDEIIRQVRYAFLSDKADFKFA